ncbi:MAG: ImmA/IrrE family metallo-endopeptidase [Sphingomonadales bacterium]|nr:ImmA/IrrE family metallo-endopeptidase [Sphingomonadales bacterium]
MLYLVELGLPTFLPDFEYEIVADGELGDAEATTSMTKQLIRISQSCYEDALKGVSRYAFTLAHEVGHLFLHTGRTVALARGPQNKAYLNPEWQADVFAAAFLMPEEGVKLCRSVEEIASKFGVSKQAASIRAENLNMRLPDLLIRKGHRPMARTP